MKTTKVTNFKSFGNANFTTLRREIEQALKTVGDKYGVDIKTAGSIGYSDTFFNIKITGTIVNESGDAMTPDAKAFKELAEFMGLNPDHLFKTFSVAGKEYKVIGLNTRASKMPVILQDMTTSKQARASVELINQHVK